MTSSLLAPEIIPKSIINPHTFFSGRYLEESRLILLTNLPLETSSINSYSFLTAADPKINTPLLYVSPPESAVLSKAAIGSVLSLREPLIFATVGVWDRVVSRDSRNTLLGKAVASFPCPALPCSALCSAIQRTQSKPPRFPICDPRIIRINTHIAFQVASRYESPSRTLHTAGKLRGAVR